MRAKTVKLFGFGPWKCKSLGGTFWKSGENMTSRCWRLPVRIGHEEFKGSGSEQVAHDYDVQSRTSHTTY